MGATPEVALPPTAVEELMQALAKALRAHQLYLPNNPVYQKAIENLRAAFRPVFEAQDELVLDVFESELHWEGNVVYSQASRNESFSWVFFKDGVRSLTLLAGVEENEILGLLDVVHRARTLQPEDNDDLLTLLWEKDFQRIRYVFQELASEGGGMALPSTDELTTSAGPGRQVAAAVEEEAPPQPGLVRADDFDTTLYFLDEREITQLRDEVNREYAQDLRRNVLAMLFDIMELQPFPTARAELIAILDSFLPHLLGAGDFLAVAYVLREVRAVLQRARELLPEQRKALADLPGRLSQPEALSQLLQSLDEAAAHPSPEELGELFAELKPEALPTLLSWLPRVSNQRLRVVLEQSLQRLASANVPDLVGAIAGADPAVTLEAVKLAGRLKLKETVAAVAQSLGHEDTAIRTAAVTALAEFATPAALQGLEKALDDADRDVRLTAVRVLMQHKHRGALPKVTAAVEGKSVRDADLTEKMAFFEAYGSLVGESGVAALDAMLNSGGFLKRKEDPETRACAALALGRIGTSSARQALERAGGSKEALVRNAVSRALRGLPPGT
ncbi:MAG TPA: HEAT repeat domain-containing protein [Gemmatimonadales bacterium]|nr:HEAT repeat domain-containing protein [Gemmatimonadales bacterium]